jgi:hypothetical protein
VNRRSFLTALVALPATQIPMPAQAVAWRPLHAEYARRVEVRRDQFGVRGWLPSTAYQPGDVFEVMVDGRLHRIPVFE